MSRLAMAATILLALGFGGYGMLQPEVSLDGEGDPLAAGSPSADFSYSLDGYGVVVDGSEKSSDCGMKKRQVADRTMCPMKARQFKVASRGKSNTLAAGDDLSSKGEACKKRNQRYSTMQAMGLCPDGKPCDDVEKCDVDAQVTQATAERIARDASNLVLYLFAAPANDETDPSHASLTRAGFMQMPVTR